MEPTKELLAYSVKATNSEQDDSTAPHLPIVEIEDGMESVIALQPVSKYSWTYSQEVEDNDDKDCAPLFRDSTGKLIGGIFYMEPTAMCKEGRTVLFNKGKLLHSFGCAPIAQLPFESSMVNWGNLFFLTGKDVLGPKGENLSAAERDCAALFSKKRPMSTRIDPMSLRKVNVYSLANEETVKQGLQKARPSGIAFRQLGDGEGILVYHRGTLGDLFDLNLWVESFQRFTNVIGLPILTRAEKRYLKSMHKKTIPECLEPTLNEVTDIALRTLVLGFPVEVAILKILETKQYSKDVSE